MKCARAGLERAGVDQAHALAQIAAHVGWSAETVARLHEPLLLAARARAHHRTGRVGVRERYAVGSC